MSVATAHVLHGINLASANFLSQLTDAAPALQHEHLVAYASGHPQPLFRAVSGQRPEVPFTTTQIKTLVDFLNAGSSPYCRDQSGGNTDLYLKKATDFGLRLAAVTEGHKRLRLAQSFVYWTSIRATQGQVAEMSARIVPTWDGTNNPIVAAGSVALAGTPVAAEQFTLGPIKINGSFFPGIGEWQLDTGTQLHLVASDGDLWPTFVAVQDVDPVLTFRSIEADAWTTFATTGTALTALILYLRRFSPNGGLYADGSSQHIKITCANGNILPESSQAGGNTPSQQAVRIGLLPTDDTTNAVTLASGEAIA